MYDCLTDMNRIKAPAYALPGMGASGTGLVLDAAQDD